MAHQVSDRVFHYDTSRNTRSRKILQWKLLLMRCMIWFVVKAIRHIVNCLEMVQFLKHNSSTAEHSFLVILYLISFCNEAKIYPVFLQHVTQLLLKCNAQSQGTFKFCVFGLQNVGKVEQYNVNTVDKRR